MLILNQFNLISIFNNNIYLLLFILLTIIVSSAIIYIFLAGRRPLSKLSEIVQTGAAALYIATTVSGSGGDDKDKKESDKKSSNSQSSNSSTSNSSNTESSSKSESSDKNTPLKALPILALFSISPGSASLNQYAFGVFILSAVAISTSVNILLYFLSMYLIKKGDYESKYPKLAWIIRRYKDVSNIYF